MQFRLRSTVLLMLLMVALTNVQAAPPPPKPQPQPKHPNNQNMQNNAANLARALAAYNAYNAYMANAYRAYYLNYLANASRYAYNPYRNGYNYGYTTPTNYGTPTTPYSSPNSTNTTAGTPGAANYTDYLYQATDDSVVRLYQLPKVDEAGLPKKYTPEELKDLKGDDPKLIGYKAIFGDLKEGQTVRLSLARMREDPKDSTKFISVPLGQLTGKVTKCDEAAKTFTLRVQPAPVGTKLAGQEVPIDPNKQVTMIVILSEPPQAVAKQ